MLEMNNEVSRIVDFIRGYCRQTGFGDLMIGLSGGIDSSLSAALALQAVGKEHLHAVNLPYRHSHPDSAKDAQTLAQHLGLELESIDISQPTDSYFDRYAPNAGRMRRGNWMARIRMNVLYDLSAKYRALVVGTSNRTELMVGYCTQYGDSACAFEPIGHLYKTEVREMAAWLGLPGEIIAKPPTADLWEGQSDESEMGITYPVLDAILAYMMDGRDRPDVTTEQLTLVQKLVSRSEFKRQMPPVPERIPC